MVKKFVELPIGKKIKGVISLDFFTQDEANIGFGLETKDKIMYTTPVIRNIKQVSLSDIDKVYIDHIIVGVKRQQIVHVKIPETTACKAFEWEGKIDVECGKRIEELSD